MTPDVFLHIAVEPALWLLSSKLDTPAARALIIAIVLQESELTSRRQAAGGPARGYAQFEKTGIKAVLNHKVAGAHLRTLCGWLDLEPTADALHTAIEFHDVLAVGLSRLLLLTLPYPLPRRGQKDIGWRQYLACWNPGKPRRETWAANFARGWTLAEPVYNGEGEHSS